MGMYQTGLLKIFDEEVVAADSSVYSSLLDLSMLRTDNATLQVEVSGEGRVKFEYLLSANGIDFMAVDGVSNTIKADIMKNSGPSANGKMLVNFTFKVAEYMKIKCTETGCVNPMTVSAWLVTR